MAAPETPIRSSLLGLVKRGDCPTCATPLRKSLASAVALCSGCGDYVRFGDKTLKPLDPASAAEAPAFAAPTPWPDMEAPTFAALTFPVAALAEMAATRAEGVRPLPASWPEGCCVCGRPSTRMETIAQRVAFSPPNGAAPRRQAEVTVVASGVPHCAAHAGGARFDRVPFFGDADVMRLGIFFRSYAYQIRFRKANPWKWRG